MEGIYKFKPMLSVVEKEEEKIWTVDSILEAYYQDDPQLQADIKGLFKHSKMKDDTSVTYDLENLERYYPDESRQELLEIQANIKGLFEKSTMNYDTSVTYGFKDRTVSSVTYDLKKFITDLTNKPAINVKKINIDYSINPIETEYELNSNKLKSANLDVENKIGMPKIDVSVWGEEYHGKWVKVYKAPSMDYEAEFTKVAWLTEIYFQNLAQSLNDSCNFISPNIYEFGLFNSSSMITDNNYKVDDIVIVKWPSFKWWQGKILEIDEENGLFHIKYDDGTKMWESASNMFKVGDNVMVEKFLKSKKILVWRQGTIKQIDKEKGLLIEYDLRTELLESFENIRTIKKEYSIYYYIEMELFPEFKTPTEVEKCKEFAEKIFETDELLKKNGFYHNDLRPDNSRVRIVDDGNLVPIIIDFGESAKKKKKYDENISNWTGNYGVDEKTAFILRCAIKSLPDNLRPKTKMDFTNIVEHFKETGELPTLKNIEAVLKKDASALESGAKASLPGVVDVGGSTKRKKTKKHRKTKRKRNKRSLKRIHKK